MKKSYPPIGETSGKTGYVEAMFDAIAPRYDLLNRVLSFGIDRQWRAKAIELLREDRPRRILDVATGTADLAIESLSLNPDNVVGVDIAEEMLSIGREKLRTLGIEDRITLRRGNAEKLPFSDAQFDAALVAFGVRNFENLEKGLAEIGRVLRRGAPLVVLEFSRPDRFPVKQVYRFYSRHVLPRIGRLVSKDRGAYQYLTDSVAAFPSGEDFIRRMEDVGFSDPLWQPLTYGIASLYKGRKS